MAQRRGTSAGKTSKTKPKAAKRAKAKPRPGLKAAASKSKAAPKRIAKTKARKAPKAKPATAKSSKPNPHQSRSPVERRRQRGAKGRRAPAFERAPAVETRGDDYVYERDTTRAEGETNDTYTPGDLVPGQVGEARPARPNGRGRRAVTRPRDSETESVTVESGAEAVRSPKGGFDEGDGGQRESEIAGEQSRTQENTGADKPALKQDYGRAKGSDGKLPE